MQLMLRFVFYLYLGLLLLLWGGVAFDDGSSFIIALFLFSPRWVVGLPLLIAVPLTFMLRRRLAMGYLLHTGIIAVPILGLPLPWGVLNEVTNTQNLRLMTYNLGEGDINPDHLASLIKHYRVDIAVLEECPARITTRLCSLLNWQQQQAAHLAIVSGLSLGESQVITRQPPSAYNAVSSIGCEVRWPVIENVPSAAQGVAGTADASVLRVVAVHFPTFRPAFELAREFNHAANTEFHQLVGTYRATADQTRHWLDGSTQATVIVGDFNVPVESAFYRDYWSGFQNALSSCGWGLCYTKYTRFHGIRIDHVLTDDAWEIRSAEVGPSLGGDHCPVIVELALKKS